MTRRLILLVCAVYAFASDARAQQTSCITTGYGQQQHLFCNTTQPFEPSPSYTAAQAGFDEAAGSAIGSALAHLFKKKDQPAPDPTVARAQAMIDAFAATHPDFPQYRAVMGQIIGAGRAHNLQDAYILARYGP